VHIKYLFPNSVFNVTINLTSNLVHILMKIFRLTILLLFIQIFSVVHAESDASKESLLGHASVTSVSNMQGFKGNTYSWVPEATQYYANPKLGDPTLQGMLQEAIANNLATKGYAFRGSEQGSDFYVGYVAALESSLSSNEIAEIYGLDPGLPEHSENLQEFEKGTLIVHMFNSSDGKLLWRGALQVEVKLKNDHNARWRRVQTAIGTLLRNFPSLKN
jgi:hypothetical protein